MCDQLFKGIKRDRNVDSDPSKSGRNNGAQASVEHDTRSFRGSWMVCASTSTNTSFSDGLAQVPVEVSGLSFDHLTITTVIGKIPPSFVQGTSRRARPCQGIA